jgi:hypothetical protein
MNPFVVLTVYGTAFLVALWLVYIRHAAWYWHVLAVAAAVALGLTRFPDGMRPPDLLTGFVFVFLFMWGVGEAAVHPYHHRHTVHHA